MTDLAHPVWLMAYSKGSGESLVKFVKINFLAGRSFIDDADLQVQCVEWQDSDNTTRPSQATDVTPASRLAAIDRLRVGNWAGPDPRHLGRRLGKPLMPRAKVSYLRPFDRSSATVRNGSGANCGSIHSDHLRRRAVSVRKSALIHASSPTTFGPSCSGRAST
jgi:hypothetical protein